MTVSATSDVYWIPAAPAIPAYGRDDWGGENDGGWGRGRLGSLILTGCYWSRT